MTNIIYEKMGVNANIINPDFNTVILDLNGTITRSISSDPRHISYRNNYIKNKIKKPVGRNLPKTTSEALLLFGLDPDEYYRHRNKNIDWNSFNSYSEATINQLNELKFLGYNLVLYTDCFLSQVKPTLSIIKATHYFNLIVSKESGYKKPNAGAYEFIAKKLGVKINKLLMIANSWQQDLYPLQSIGGNTIWIKSEKYLNEAVSIIAKTHLKKLHKKNYTISY